MLVYCYSSRFVHGGESICPIWDCVFLYQFHRGGYVQLCCQFVLFGTVFYTLVSLQLIRTAICSFGLHFLPCTSDSVTITENLPASDVASRCLVDIQCFIYISYE